MSLVIFPLIYLAAPAAVIIQAAAVNMVPLSGPGSLFSRLGFLDALVLLCYPVSALAILSVRRAGWWIFIAASSWLIANNVAAFALNPLVSPLSTLLFDAALVAAAAMFFRRHAIAPYFNPRLRPWESPPRYRLDVSAAIAIDGAETPIRVVDLSRGGAFAVPLALPAPRVGTHGEFSLRVAGAAYRIPAAVVRRQAMPSGDTGYGIMFTGGRGLESVTEAMEASLRGLPLDPVPVGADQRASRRFSFMPAMTIEAAGPSASPTAASLDDLSRGGLAARVLSGDLEGEAAIAAGAAAVAVLEGRRALRLPGTVAWSHEEGGATRFGLRFGRLDRRSRTTLRRYLRFLRRVGAEERMPDPAAMEAVLEETLERSPYRAVAWFRRRLGLRS